MKELNEIVLGKGLFVSIKGPLCLTKGHLGDQEGQVEIKYRNLSKFSLDTFDSNRYVEGKRMGITANRM